MQACQEPRRAFARHPAGRRIPNDQAPRKRITQPVAKSTHTASRRKPVPTFQSSWGSGCQNRISANSARLAMCTNVHRSKAAGMRMTCFLNQGRAITECCSPNRAIKPRSMSAAAERMKRRSSLVDGRQRPPGQQLAWLGQKNNEACPERPHDCEAGPRVKGSEDGPIVRAWGERNHARSTAWRRYRFLNRLCTLQ